MKNGIIIAAVLLLQIVCVFCQLYDNEQPQLEDEDSYEDSLLMDEDYTEFDDIDQSNVYLNEYFPAVAVASFTGPNIVGEFSFSQDTTGDVVATGAFQKGLKQDAKYKFSFYEGPSCEALGNVLFEHEFVSLHAVNMGGTPPIQELIPDIHLTGENGYIGVPWVLSDSQRNLACVMLKGPESE